VTKGLQERSKCRERTKRSKPESYHASQKGLPMADYRHQRIPRCEHIITRDRRKTTTAKEPNGKLRGQASQKTRRPRTKSDEEQTVLVCTATIEGPSPTCLILATRVRSDNNQFVRTNWPSSSQAPKKTCHRRKSNDELKDKYRAVCITEAFEQSTQR
jgi:hypothetical protein